MDDLISLLKSTFGFGAFRPGQAEAIDSLAADRHTLVVMPTGAGKSLVYQFAAVRAPGVTLVISPLISLMQDQVEALARRRIPATFINSSIPGVQQIERLDAMADNQYRLVYVAPERLRSTAFRAALSKVKVSLLAVDEAHCVSQWGHDFRPDYLHIAAARESIGSPLTVALTATATPEVRADIAELLGLGDVNHIVTGFNRPNLTFEVSYCRDVPGKLRALLGLLQSFDTGAAIVYVGTRRDAEEVASFISEVVGIPARFYHGGMPSEVREIAQREFMTGGARVVVATNSFGMGIDRADVRLVVHYAIPGSLEAYYQEAGRAGRDGEPARAVLLYATDDRSLQEYFIDNSVLNADDLRALHSSLAREQWLSSDDISVMTGLHQVAVRVGLSVLESVGAVKVLGSDGPRFRLAPGPLDETALDAAVRQAIARADNKRAQLDRAVHYAESNSCRRRIILNHFGDPADPIAPKCCDNCLAAPERDAFPPNPDGAKLTPQNKTALLILDTIRDLRWGIGRGKLAKLLKGSRSQDVTNLGYDRNPRYGKLGVFSLTEIEGLVDQVVDGGYLKAIGGKLPVLSLTPRGEAALASRAAIALTFPREVTKSKTRQPRAREMGDTLETTMGLSQQGMAPAQIAQERGLAISTIQGHFAQLIGQKRVALDAVVPDDRVAVIRAAIAQVEDLSRLWPVKELLPEDFTYEEIRCVLAADGRQQGTEPAPPKPDDPIIGLVAALESPNVSVRRYAAKALGNAPHPFAVQPLIALLATERNPQVRQYAVKSLGKIGDARALQTLQEIAAHSDESEYVRLAAEGAARQCQDANPDADPAPEPPCDAPTEPVESDPVAAYLAQSHPRPLAGPWRVGWALGFHSSFAGSEWSRSGVGQMTYRLKYRGDESALRPLVEQALAVCRDHPELAAVDALVPVPPSTARSLDPVTAFCEALGAQLGLPVLLAVSRMRKTSPQKEMHTLAQKRANVAGAFAATEDVRGRRVLVVDDLHDSGATLEEVVLSLKRAGASSASVLTLTRTIHSDS